MEKCTHLAEVQVTRDSCYSGGCKANLRRFIAIFKGNGKVHPLSGSSSQAGFLLFWGVYGNNLPTEADQAVKLRTEV